MFDWVKRGVNVVRSTVERGAKAIDVPKPPTPQQVIDFGKSVFETTTNAAKKVVTDPKDFARDALREGLRVGYEGMNKVLPDAALPYALKGMEVAVDVATRPVAKVLGTDNPVGNLANDLSKVDLEQIARREGLKADWGRLWGTWLFEQKPADLGKWEKVTVDGQEIDQVTITRPDYTGDLASRPHQQAALAKFMRQHDNNPKPGDALKEPLLYVFKGSDTAEGGNLTALEWFTGSYRTNIRCVGNDPDTGKPILQFEVTNESHWESATRVPATGQNAGFGDHLVPDARRDTGLGIGGDFRQKYVWTQTAP